MATEPLSIERLKNLTVVDLRQELDKRGLEKSGLKADLIKRLEKVDTSSKFLSVNTTSHNWIMWWWCVTLFVFENQFIIGKLSCLGLLLLIIRNVSLRRIWIFIYSYS